MDDLERFITRCLMHSRISLWLSIDLTMPQLKALLLVAEAPDGVTGSQLARALGVSLSTVTGLVDRLCEHGLATRGEDPADRRATRVTPTAAGQDLVAQLYRLRRERLTYVLEHLGAPALAVTARAAHHLAEAAAAASGAELGAEPDDTG